MCACVFAVNRGQYHVDTHLLNEDPLQARTSSVVNMGELYYIIVFHISLCVFISKYEEFVICPHMKVFLTLSVLSNCGIRIGSIHTVIVSPRLVSKSSVI